MKYSKVVNGTIAILQRLRPKDRPTDILFVGTERFEYFTLAWNPETSELEAIDEGIKDPGELHMRHADSENMCIVDPTGRYLTMHLWEGVLTIIRLGSRKNTILKLEWMDQVRLSELFVKTSTFLYTETGHPKIAILYKTRSDGHDLKLATYRLTSDDRHTQASRFEPKDREIDCDILDPGASLLIPVRKVEEEVKRHNVRNVESAKAHVGGLVVVGETRLLYVDEVTKTKVESKLKKANIFVAWAEYDATHYFLADDYGSLHLLTILTNGVVVTGMDVTEIGKISRPKELVYFGNGALFVGSHYGDSQLFYVDLTKADIKEMMQLVQTLPNIGPIFDFAVMDMGNRENDSALGNEYSSGQARIVTGSGYHKDGSLRSVRSGVGLEDVGILGDLDDTRGLFPIRSYGSPKTDTLVASFLTETRIFTFDSQGEVEEMDSFSGMDLEHQTLVASNLPDGNVLQVTTTSATVFDAESGVVVSSWAPDGENLIVAASANDQWLLLSIGGTRLVSLSLQKDLRVVREKEIGEKDQIACIHVAPRLPNVGVVGFWSSGAVSIIDLHTLEPIHGELLRKSSDDSSIPRDLALVQVLPPNVSGPTLFVALEDGNVVTFKIGEDLTLSGTKRVVLGTRQARFHLLPQANGLHSVFATADHPSLIYGSQGRIVYSAVTAEDAAVVCSFDAEAFPEAIVLATDSQIRISRIDTARQTHTRSIPMGETIRRIAYSPSDKVFGLGCVRRELIDGEEILQSSFKLVDDVVFDKVGSEFLISIPSYTEIVEAVIRAELPDSYGNPAERFIVGTAYEPDPSYGGTENAQGRILVFGIDDERDPYLILSHKLKGACRALEVIDDKIVAALTKTVVVSLYDETSTTSAQLTRLASYRTATYPVDIAVEGNMIAVADTMKSISLVEFVTGGGESPRLIERARHYHSAWATAVSHIDGESWLEADSHGNLMVLVRNPDGVTLEDKRRLQITSEMNLGENVNRIRKIRVETSPGAMVIPRAFLGTVRFSFPTTAWGFIIDY